MASNAIDSSLISKVVGYEIQKGNFGVSTPNLPQRIVILGEANTTMQGDVSFNEAIEITSAVQAGNIFGFGSPIHMAMNILRPNSGSGVAGIPTVVYCQEQVEGATEKVLSITATGTATANVTHTLQIAGRSGVNGQNYSFTVNTDDTPTQIHAKIEDAINAVLGSPMYAELDGSVLAISKWKGISAKDLTVLVNTNGNSAGITYSVSLEQEAAGLPDIQPALDDFGNTWNTVVLNTYGIQTTVVDALEAFNGKPTTIPTGRYSAIIWKPFFAFTGYTDIDMTDATDFTNARKDEVTIAICPAPGSLGLQFEAAANYAVLYAVQAQNDPAIDISGRFLPDMPTPVNIGLMDIYLERNAILLKGCSTVQLLQSQFQVMDFVTTYHPDGETPAQYRYVRNLTVDMNFRYSYFLLENLYVVDKIIANDNAVVENVNVIKPKSWKQILTTSLVPDLEKRGLITDRAFSVASIQVNISSINPDRFETTLNYKRTGFVRQASTTVQAGFNFAN
jgi:phage tail sheath gpL-like